MFQGIVELIQNGVYSNLSILKNMGVFDLDRFSRLPQEFFYWIEGVFRSVALVRPLAGVVYNLSYQYTVCYTELFGITPRKGQKSDSLHLLAENTKDKIQRF